MKKLYLATSLTFLLSTQAFAQDVIMDQSDLEALDKDGDGIVSKQEYKGFTRFAFTTIDADNDGALSPDEVGGFWQVMRLAFWTMTGVALCLRANLCPRWMKTLPRATRTEMAC